MCITDHESLTAHLSAIEYVESHKEDPDWKDFKLGLGNEIYLCPSTVTAENTKNNIYPHFILVALDEYGYKGLRELSTKAWVDNSFMSVMYRVPTYYSDLQEMLEKYKGHLIGSSACIGGSLPRRILEFRNSDDSESKTIWESCKLWIENMKDLFGNGYFFLELQPSESEEQMYVNDQLVSLARITNTPYIITTDAHYLKKEDRDIHKAFLNAQDGDREVDEFYASTYVMSPEEIHWYMDSYLGSQVVQKGLDNTLRIYDMIQSFNITKPLEIPYLPLDNTEPDLKLVEKYEKHIPLLKELNSSTDSDRHMLRELVKSINSHPHYQTDEGYAAVSECLDYLLKSSEKMNVHWSAYLMQVRDYINIAWQTGSLVGAGRGSGVGFCLLYLLGITQIDPLRETTKTYPWRFLNPYRASVLDIDTDVQGGLRDKIIQALKDTYGSDRVSKVLTLQTEKSRSAILTAARGLGIDNDTASYIASLVVFDRGMPRSLKTMYYGNEEYPPSPEFVREMDARPELWRTAEKIEGLVCGCGQHAGGVIIYDKPLTEATALMRTKSGDIVTQSDLHKSEKMGLIKIDLLAIDALEKIHAELDLLLKDGVIEWQGTLRDTYEKYLGVYTLERENEEMWKMLWEHKVLSFFQMEKESGKKAIALSKPHSVDDLATLNSVIRLMAQEKGAEQPLDKFARFKNDITQWYKEMDDYGLTKEEQGVLKDILGTSYGVCEAQEYLVLLTSHPKIGGFDIVWGDKLRKAVAKKSPKDFDNLEKEFFENAKNKGLSEALTNYTWKVLINTQRGYGFNKSHTLAYSIIGLQELNLAYKYPIIYWNTANLIVDSGSLDEESNDSTNYGKIGIAIANVQHEGVPISFPSINSAEFGFSPDIPNQRIIFGLKGINGINTELSQQIIANRPYESMEDFAKKMLDTGIVKTSQMVKLIKAGCFTELHDKNRRNTLDWYINHYLITPVTKLTMQQLNKMKEAHLIPEQYERSVKTLAMKKYILDDEGFYKNYIDPEKKMLKRGYHDRWFILDDIGQEKYNEFFTENCIVDVVDGHYIVSEKKIEKECEIYLQPLREWFISPEAINRYNWNLTIEMWEKYGEGTPAHWSMEALCYYNAEHELDRMDEQKYGVVNFFDQPEQPTSYEFYTRYVNGEPKIVPKYNITRIAGTVLNADNNHHTVALLTKYGLVNVKMNKGHYAFYSKTISKVNEKGEKTRLEESWLKRGNLLLIAGIRRDDQFWPMIYTDTIYKHTVNLIQDVYNDGTLKIQVERIKI